MSDGDGRFNPFGRGDRTIIRPNPGGRLPAARPNPLPAPAAPQAPPLAPVPVGAPATNPAAPTSPIPAPATAAPFATAPATHAAEDWIKTAAKPPPEALPAAPMPMMRIEELAAPNANPIMRAAGPLLQLLGRLRVSLLRASFASLMEQVAEAIKFFEKDIRSAGISEQQANSAKYVLCATADDIVQHIPTDDRHVWTQYSMLSRFFGERVGGVRFFDILNHAKLDPLVNYPLLELQHTCLALGFQGQYRPQAGGLATLQQIQRDLYETLRRIRPRVMRDLSPRWQGQSLALNLNRVRVPTWVVASAAAALLFALFVTLRILLAGNAEQVAEKTAILHPLDKLDIKRRLIVATPAATPALPPPPPAPAPAPQLERIRKELKIGDCSVVEQTAKQIIIRLCSQVTFDPAQAIVKDQFKPLAARIAALLDKEEGVITVVGHTDNTPMKTVRFPSNFELSVARAQAVAALISGGLANPGRIKVVGRGSDVPIASNATPEGRAKNRRVEVAIGRAND
jgi:type VI secretion system protein ImpK